MYWKALSSKRPLIIMSCISRKCDAQEQANEGSFEYYCVWYFLPSLLDDFSQTCIPPQSLTLNLQLARLPTLTDAHIRVPIAPAHFTQTTIEVA